MKQRIASLLCDVRNLTYLLDKIEFELFYKCLDKETKNSLDELIINCVNIDFKVRMEARRKLESYIKEDSIYKLKCRAAQLGIPRYSRMDKATLISEISNAANSRHRGSLEQNQESVNGVGVQG